jgi:hypothetical protein
MVHIRKEYSAFHFDDLFQCIRIHFVNGRKICVDLGNLGAFVFLAICEFLSLFRANPGILSQPYRLYDPPVPLLLQLSVLPP